jgi:hypothetical protein
MIYGVSTDKQKRGKWVQEDISFIVHDPVRDHPFFNFLPSLILRWSTFEFQKF